MSAFGLSPEELAVAERLGISPAAFAAHKAQYGAAVAAFQQAKLDDRRGGAESQTDDEQDHEQMENRL